MPRPSHLLARLLVGLCLLAAPAVPAVALTGCGDDAPSREDDRDSGGKKKDGGGGGY